MRCLSARSRFRPKHIERSERFDNDTLSHTTRHCSQRSGRIRAHQAPRHSRPHRRLRAAYPLQQTPSARQESSCRSGQRRRSCRALLRRLCRACRRYVCWYHARNLRRRSEVHQKRFTRRFGADSSEAKRCGHHDRHQDAYGGLQVSDVEGVSLSRERAGRVSGSEGASAGSEDILLG